MDADPEHSKDGPEPAVATSDQALLFDVDGTLVDSNYLHVDAWQRAFDAMGESVDAWRIHRAIGQDSARLVGSLVGDRGTAWVDKVKKTHSEFYTRQIERLRAFPGARDTLFALHDAGFRIVLATSAPADELSHLRAVLDADDAIDAVTNADDVQAAKPDPGIVEVALGRAGVAAARSLFVGDATWDMVAARRAGVVPIGVRSGGVGTGELTDAGAEQVFTDVHELFESMRSDNPVEWVRRLCGNSKRPKGEPGGT